MQVSDTPMEGSGRKLDSRFKLLFGTQHTYSFLRLFTLLVKILADTRELLEEEEKESDAMDVDEEKSEKDKCGYGTVVSSLKKCLSKGMTPLDFERVCRKACMDRVAQLAVLPKLVEKCADILCKLAKDGTIFTLNDYTMTKEADPVKLRSQCSSVSENSCYRIQLDTTGGWIYFSYIEPDQDLLVVPEFEEEEEDEEMDEAGATYEHDEQTGEENEDGEAQETAEEGEETEDAEDGEIGEIEGLPDAKRPKLK
jgi:chromatin remodeling complex protein RSC6